MPLPAENIITGCLFCPTLRFNEAGFVVYFNLLIKIFDNFFVCIGLFFFVYCLKVLLFFVFLSITLVRVEGRGI